MQTNVNNNSKIPVIKIHVSILNNNLLKNDLNVYNLLPNNNKVMAIIINNSRDNKNNITLHTDLVSKGNNKITSKTLVINTNHVIQIIMVILLHHIKEKFNNKEIQEIRVSSPKDFKFIKWKNKGEQEE